MKRIALASISTLATLFAFALILPNPAPLKLTWDYPTKAMDTNLTFNLYSHTNPVIPLSNWVRVAEFPAANWFSNGVCIAPLTNYNGTNWHILTITNMTTPGAQFYYVVASNFWGEFSVPSNTLGLPAVPSKSENLKAQRGW